MEIVNQVMLTSAVIAVFGVVNIRFWDDVLGSPPFWLKAVLSVSVLASIVVMFVSVLVRIWI